MEAITIEQLRRTCIELWMYDQERLHSAVIELGTNLDVFYADVAGAEAPNDYDLLELFLNASGYPYTRDTGSALDHLSKRDILLVFVAYELQRAQAVVVPHPGKQAHDESEFRLQCLRDAAAALRRLRGLH